MSRCSLTEPRRPESPHSILLPGQSCLFLSFSFLTYPGRTVSPIFPSSSLYPRRASSSQAGGGSLPRELEERDRCLSLGHLTGSRGRRTPEGCTRPVWDGVGEEQKSGKRRDLTGLGRNKCGKLEGKGDQAASVVERGRQSVCGSCCPAISPGEGICGELMARR